MKLISSKKDLQAWFDYDKTYRTVDGRLPDSISLILNKTDGYLFPSHCDQDLLEEIFIDVLTKMQPAFKVDEFCKPVIKTMIQYCRGESDLNHQKGLLLMGGVGSGKTLLMRGYNRFLCRFRNDSISFYPGFSEVATYNLVSGFAQYGYEIFEKGIIGMFSNQSKSVSVDVTVQLIKRNLFIDDIGSEDTTAFYGNSTNVVYILLMRRYDDLKYKTHGTTNLDAKALRAYYGDRVFSRMKEMFNTIYLQGEDRRK